jgi:hypothetical protein
MLYLLMQVVSYVVLQASCSPYVLGELWVHGALGPLAGVEAVSRFQYHSWMSDAGFVGVCVLVLIAPLAYVVRPHVVTLVVSGMGLVVWWVFGLGFTIHNM